MSRVRIGNPVATTYPDGSTHAAQTAAYIAGISGKTVASGVTVIVGTDGHLGTVTSSARFKEAIKPMDKASEAILALLARDADGKVNAVRYEAVNAMLLNAFLKEHRNVAEQQSTIAELKTTVAQQQKQIAAQQAKAAQQEEQIEALTATVQKVSNQVALSKPAPQLVANP